jgi:hypothetical protein
VYAGTDDVVEALKRELSFINEAESRGIGPAGLLREGPVFRNSPLCTELRNAHFDSCSHCPLLGFVPATRRFEDVPCHHIPLNASGETVATIDFLNQQYRVYGLLRNWLQSAIERIERARESNRGFEALLLYAQDDRLAGLRPLLEALGLQTSRAKTLKELSNLLESPITRPSLLLTEPILPDGTWLDVLEILKKESAAAALVVVSTEVDRKLPIEVLEQGAFDCLVYPVAVPDLAHIVRCALWSSCLRRRTT